MNNKKYDDVINKIKNYKKIICLRHINPDGDAYGSSMGMAQFIRENFPDKKVLVDGKNSKYLNFLGKSDFVNESDYSDSLIIVTDTANIERIDSEFWKKSKEIIKIDHHIEYKNNPSSNYANISIIEDNVGSASEIVAKIILHSKLHLSKETSKFLYTGIITDTGRFQYVGVTSTTFTIAAKLIDTGLNIFEIYNKLYISEFNDLQLQSFFISKVKLTKKGIGYICISDEDMKKKNITLEDVKIRINIMKNVRQIKIWFIAIENIETNEIKISIRSSKYVINKLAEKYSGGGHKLAAGAKISKWNQLKKFIKDLEKKINEKNIIKI